MNFFEPKIVGFLCNWCSYEGADAAGRARIESPADFKAVRVMCSGRVDPRFILEAFGQGADGVLILGCPPGSCHYKTGNFEALKKITILKRMLEPFGVDGERLKMDWISAVEGDKFGKVVTGMVEKVRRLGPLERRTQPR